ncbi:MAG: hypothetical protein GYB68_10010 [Chloroflexi bacterium]|nr:hypothetical protein [Chloroflexota bacterium]
MSFDQVPPIPVFLLEVEARPDDEGQLVRAEIQQGNARDELVLFDNYSRVDPAWVGQVCNAYLYTYLYRIQRQFNEVRQEIVPGSFFRVTLYGQMNEIAQGDFQDRSVPDIKHNFMIDTGIGGITVFAELKHLREMDGVRFGDYVELRPAFPSLLYIEELACS